MRDQGEREGGSREGSREELLVTVAYEEGNMREKLPYR